MADEVPDVTEVTGEIEPEVFEGEDKEEEDAREESPGEIFFRTETPRESLLSDFCAPEYAEEPGEAIWVCEAEGGEEERGYEEEYEYEEYGEEGEESEIELEERRSLDSEYLKSVLGTPLTFAMLEIASRRPTDPIQYLAHFLLNWRWAEKDKSKYEMEMKILNEEREAYQNKLREIQRQEMLAQEERLEEEMRGERIESNIDEGEGRSLISGEL